MLCVLCRYTAICSSLRLLLKGCCSCKNHQLSPQSSVLTDLFRLYAACGIFVNSGKFTEVIMTQIHTFFVTVYVDLFVVPLNFCKNTCAVNTCAVIQ